MCRHSGCRRPTWNTSRRPNAALRRFWAMRYVEAGRKSLRLAQACRKPPLAGPKSPYGPGIAALRGLGLKNAVHAPPDFCQCPRPRAARLRQCPRATSLRV